MRLSRKAPVLLLLLAALLLTLAVVAPLAAAGNKPLAPNKVGAKAYWYVDQLSRVTNDDGSYSGLLRQAGTASEVVAAEKVASWFVKAGYKPAIQPFTYVRNSVTYNSQNVVAWRPADLKRKGQPRPLVIVGAHYDAVTRGRGRRRQRVRGRRPCSRWRSASRTSRSTTTSSSSPSAPRRSA